MIIPHTNKICFSLLKYISYKRPFFLKSCASGGIASLISYKNKKIALAYIIIKIQNQFEIDLQNIDYSSRI